MHSLVRPDGYGQKDDKSKRPSPPASAQCKFADAKAITVDYSSPRAKGRKIFGGVGSVRERVAHWSERGNNICDHGRPNRRRHRRSRGQVHAVYAPRGKEWKLIINKQTGQWGTEYDKQQDLLRADMNVSTVPAKENFTISFHEMARAAIFTWMGHDPGGSGDFGEVVQSVVSR